MGAGRVLCPIGASSGGGERGAGLVDLWEPGAGCGCGGRRRVNASIKTALPPGSTRCEILEVMEVRWPLSETHKWVKQDCITSRIDEMCDFGGNGGAIAVIGDP